VITSTERMLRSCLLLGEVVGNLMECPSADKECNRRLTALRATFEDAAQELIALTGEMQAQERRGAA